MIAIFPMQSGYLPWTWLRVQAIALFALPIWLILHFGLMPLRRK
jgi:drug/metabolite transporter superfamily protein YnfA